MDGTSPSRRRILLVDSFADGRRALCETLEQQGYDVRIAYCMMEALRMLRQQRYSALITEIDFPPQIAISVVEEIRHDPVLSSLPMIVLTVDDDVDLSAGLGPFTAVHRKPVQMADLLATLSALG